MTDKREDFMSYEVKSAAMPTDLKLKNRMKILDVFRESGEKSINVIADITGISRQTIVKSTNFFLEKGLIYSRGKGSSTEIGGKKPELYIFNDNYRFFLYVIISPENVITGIINLSGSLVDSCCFHIGKDEDIEVIAENSGKCFNELLKKNNIDEKLIYSVGICTSGIYDRFSGIMRYNSIFPQWGKNIPIFDIFKRVVPENCRIFIDNEAKAAGKAELVKDKSLNDKRVLVIYSAEGIAAALIENGNIVYGKNSLVGEIGHLFLESDGDIVCECGLNGCFEHTVSDERLFKVYGKSAKSVDEIFMAGRNDKSPDYINARKAVCYAAQYFSAAIRNIILLADPDVIIIQGKFAKAGKFFADIIKDKIHEFKYFGREQNLDLRLDDDDTMKLKVMGMSELLAENLFLDESVYR